MKKVMKAVAALILIGMKMFFAMPCIAEQVQPETAQRVAQSFLRSNRNEISDLADVSAEVGFPNLYIFTSADSFVVMSADDRIQPILGYSLTGGFNTEEMPDQVRWWLQGYNDQIQYLVENASSPTQEVMRQWQELASGIITINRLRTIVGPLITTTWSQGYPYNNLCPNGSVTGCVATAMAQLMKYWNYPQHGIGWHTYTPFAHPEYGELTADFNSTYYDWTNMTNTYGNTSTNTQQQAVATLMYHCGVSVDMNYSPTGSGAGIVHDAFKDYFNYSSEIQYLVRENYADGEWIAIIRNELNALRPVYYTGHGSGGHAFICDGYDSGTYNNYYFHFNWGWGGWCDGYFSINNMDPDGNDFNNYQTMTIGIQPSSNNANPTNLTYTQNGRDITLHWSTASGAVGYNIYRDMNLVGTVTTLSYTYTAPFGESKYYVRSVDSNGELSLSTNSVTVNVAYPIPLVDDLSATVIGDDVSLSWTAPEWCYPQTPSATLTYGNGNYEGNWGSNGTTTLYWGHKYPAASLSSYGSMAIYKVSFYANEMGAYQLYLYQGTTSGRPQTQVWQQSVSVGKLGWFDIDLSDIVQIDATQDLWVFIFDPETRDWPATGCVTEGVENNYYSYSVGPTNWIGVWDNVTFLIRTYLTDGIYSYNIYRNGSNIASNVSATTYNDNDLTNGTYTYYVKTNYYAGESTASNSVTAQVNVTWCTINTSCEPANGGTATGGGTYYNGQNCTLTATSATGYTFVNWTKDGIPVSTNPTYNFTVTESATYIAHFQLQSYTVSVSADPTNGGSVSGGGTFNHGQSCTVHAAANTGYTFVNWTENGTPVSTNANYTFTVTGNRTLVAHFQLQSYTVSVSADPTNGGSVSGGGTFNHGQSCTVHAAANTGYTFVNWTENGTPVSTNGNYTFIVTGNRMLVAHFQLQSYTVSVSADPTNGGSVSGGGTFNHGQSCTVHAAANTGYTFVNWTENGTPVSTNDNYTFTVTGNRTLVAHFQLQTYTITATADPTAGGSVIGGDIYNYGASCTLSATANQGYTFVNWTRNGTEVSTNAIYTFTVTESATYVAHFQIQTYTIFVSADPTAGGTVSGGGTYVYGQSCTVHATSNTGHNFVNWTENGTQVSTSANYTFTVTNNRNLVAHFSTSSYIITAVADPADGGVVSGSGGYDYGDQCTLTATANQGYTFINWTRNGTEVSTNAIYTFTVTESATYVAHFQAQSYTISVTTEPTEGGSVSGEGVYTYGQNCTVFAVANTGYNFVNWTENGTVVSTDADYTFTVTGNRSLVAHFSIGSFIISAMTDPDNGGGITGVGSYDYGQTCTLSVEPYENYTFISWTENDTVVSEQRSFSFTVEGTRSFVAHLFYYDGFSENHDIDIDLYPNPVKNTLTIKVSQPIKNWEIFSTSGAKLYGLDENADIMEMHISHFDPGTYVIRMTTNDAVFIRKFVKE